MSGCNRRVHLTLMLLMLKLLLLLLLLLELLLLLLLKLLLLNLSLVLLRSRLRLDSRLLRPNWAWRLLHHGGAGSWCNIRTGLSLRSGLRCLSQSSRCLASAHPSHLLVLRGLERTIDVSLDILHGKTARLRSRLSRLLLDRLGLCLLDRLGLSLRLRLGLLWPGSGGRSCCLRCRG